MASQTVEERLAQLESKVDFLMAKTRPDFLDAMVGIHANSPLFDEVVRSLEEEREREREAAGSLDSEDYPDHISLIHRHIIVPTSFGKG